MATRVMGFAFMVSAIVYALTLCPSVYVEGSGELIGAVSMLGTPHPTGYPLFCLVGRVIVAALPLGNAALVVLPSELEGFPIALLEAMRYARPVLAADIPEHLEALQPGVNGFTFPVADTSALAERMQWILAHPGEATAAAQRAAEDAKVYDWDRITDQTESIYRDTLATPSNSVWL